MTVPRFRFQIFTPDRTFAREEIVAVEAPGAAGCLAILAGHAPIVVGLEAGEVRVVGSDGAPSVWKIGGGTLEVAPDGGVTVLARFARPPAIRPPPQT